MTSDPHTLSETILGELENLWAGMGKQPSETAVLRACAMTAIVVSDEGDDPVHVGETLATLMREHPGRAILLWVRAGDEGELEHRVTAQCWMPFGRRQQICCEQIELTTSRRGLAEALQVLQGIVVADLPLVVWCRSREIGDLPAMRPLFGLANKVILDSWGAADAGPVLVRFAQLAARGVRVADLNWTRLTRWRKAIAQIFDRPEQRARLPEITRLSVTHRNATPPPTAYYLAAWSEHVLGRRLETEFSEEPGSEEGYIQQVTLSGPNLEYSVRRVTGDQIRLKMNSMEVSARFPFLADHELLHEELSIMGPDEIYDGVLRLAVQRSGEDRKRA